MTSDNSAGSGSYDNSVNGEEKSRDSIDEYLAEITDPSLISYSDLMKMDLNGKNEIGLSLPRFNYAIRIDSLRDRKTHFIKNPHKFNTLLSFFSKVMGVRPSHGLRINRKSSSPLFVHMVLELSNGSSYGIFFHDVKKTLSFKEVFNAEKAVKLANLSGAIIIGNIIGLPAKSAATRLNTQYGKPIIQLFHFSEIENDLNEGSTIS